METCVHHWKQEAGDIHAPFVCKRCGEAKVMETDFYRLYEARFGRPWDRTEPSTRGTKGISIAA